METPDLSSWKEIAAFLGVDVKTAQRWEKLRGLPVRRLPGGQRGLVRASAEEIRRWLDSGQETPEPVRAGLVAGQAAEGIWVRWLLAGAAVALLAAAGWALATGAGRPHAIAKAEMRGNTLTALDERGEPVWTHTFNETLVSPQPNEDWSVYLQRIRWKKDVLPELVAGVRFAKPGETNSRVLCFDARGKQRWTWEPSVQLLDFDGEPFEKDWVTQHVLADHSGRAPIVWVAVSNPMRWASALFRIDSEGAAKLQFANAGSIMRVLRLPNGRLLAAGVNNAWAKPFLAEIDAEGPPAFSPPSGPDRYHFSNGPKGLPKRYFLLPQSEISRLQDVQYFHVSNLSLAGDRIVVETITGNRPIYLYQFDTELRPMKVRATASAVGMHQALERKGLAEHPVERCPEMTRTHTVREWTPESGWWDHAVPASSAFNLR